uniref:Aspartate aminotransferase family protein n=1 Tax=viral metagenome TaxID=1070528 RepID=A0A6C0J4Y1_9ZZZZ
MNIIKNIPRGVIKNNLLIASHAKGCWVWDIKGNQYLDMTSGIGALSTGHSHPKVINRVKKQLDKIVHAQQNCFLSHTEQEILINKLVGILPNGHNNIYFTNSGTESIENAIKIARMSTNKPNIITMNGGFHGRSLGAMSLCSSKVSYKKGFQPLLPGVFFCNQYNIESFNNIIENQTSPDETCAVIMEPILGEKGIIQLPKDFVKHIRKICTENNIKLIFDEVQCGSGRTGKWWASEYWDIIPDLMTFAKGIGSGFPIGGVSGNSDVFDLMSKNSLGGTYNGNAIATSASIATIDTIIEENLLNNANIMGDKIKKELESFPHIKEIRQHGLFIGIDIEKDINVNNIIKEAINNNLLLITCGDNSIRLLPPLIINEKEVEIFFDSFYKTLNKF